MNDGLLGNWSSSVGAKNEISFKSFVLPETPTNLHPRVRVKRRRLVTQSKILIKDKFNYS